jgi:hypothetical protein
VSKLQVLPNERSAAAKLNLNDYSMMKEPELAQLKGSCFAGYKISKRDVKTGSLRNLKHIERMRAAK